MGIKKGDKQAKSFETRKLIVSTANKLFLEKGFKNTTSALIAQAAEISPGLFYFYFKDKTSLFTNWLNSLLETCHDYLYNQFKLKDYNVETTLIAANIIEKLSETIFSSPAFFEDGDAGFKNMINMFLSKLEHIFISSCFDASINLPTPELSAYLIINLIRDYSKQIKNSHLNKESLLHKYALLITTLIETK